MASCTVRLDGTDIRALDLPPSDLTAVSRSGELAIVTKHRLARVPLSGGAPRELLDNAMDLGGADWIRFSAIRYSLRSNNS
jgi:hypothetical protein